MPIEQIKVQPISSLSNSHQVQFANPVAPGRYVVIIWKQGTANRTPGIPVPSAGAWAGAQDFLATSGGTSGRVYCWSGQQTGVATDTYTITIASSLTALGGIVAYELSGVDVNGTPKGAGGVQSLASSASWNLIPSPGITLNSGEILIGAAATDATSWGTGPSPSGFTTDVSSNLAPWVSTWVGNRVTSGTNITGSATVGTPRAVVTGYQVYLPVPSGTLISVNETGSSNDSSLTVMCSAGVNDSGAHSEALNGSCSFTQTEFLTSLDDINNVNVLLAAILDSGNALDVISQIQQGLLIALSEAGLGTDFLADLACTFTEYDACQSVDVEIISNQLQLLLDTCVGADVLSCEVSLTEIDVSTSAEQVSCSVELSLSEIATGIDLLTGIAVVLALSEQCGGLETLNVQTGAGASGRVATISFVARTRQILSEHKTKSTEFDPNL